MIAFIEFWALQEGWDWARKLVVLIGSEIAKLIVWVFNTLKAFGDLAMSGLFRGLSSVFPSVPWDSARSALNGLNYFFPLSECISFATILLGLWITVFLYRLVKSWAPTVSS